MSAKISHRTIPAQFRAKNVGMGTLRPEGWKVLRSGCLYVCLFVRIWKTTHPNFTQIFYTCYLWPWCSTLDGNAICCV